MNRRNFAKALPVALVAPSLLAPSAAAAWPSNLQVATLHLPNTPRDELPSLVKHPCHFVRPDGTLLRSSAWRYVLMNENDVILAEKTGFRFFKEKGLTLDHLRDLVHEQGTPTIELHILCEEGVVVHSFVPEAEVYDIINRLLVRMLRK